MLSQALKHAINTCSFMSKLRLFSFKRQQCGDPLAWTGWRSGKDVLPFPAYGRACPSVGWRYGGVNAAVAKPGLSGADLINDGCGALMLRKHCPRHGIAGLSVNAGLAGASLEAPVGAF
jgi:hypothetical protein